MDYEDLARRLVEREEQAFIDFARGFVRQFRALFINYGLPEFQADDLAATCVVDFALKAKHYRTMSKGGFRAWVMTLAKNAAMDWHRTKKVKEEELSDKVLDSRNDKRSAPGSDRTQAVRDAMQQLRMADRLIVELRDFDPTHSYEEISELLGLQPGTARVRHLRALRRLEAILKNDPRIAIPAPVAGKGK
jgi:RNA polymerase sigma factor (sigma-70 family)